MFGDLKLLIFLLIPAFAALLAFRQLLTRAEQRRVGIAGAAFYIFIASAAFLSPTLWVMYGACLVSIPLFARRIDQVAPLMLVGLVALPALSMELRAGSALILQVNVQLIISLSALLALFTARGRLARFRLSEAMPAIILAALYVAISVRDVVATDVLRTTISIFFRFVAPVLVVLATTRTIAQIRTLVLYVALTAAALTGVALFEAVMVWPVYRSLYAHYPEAISTYSVLVYKMRAGFLRSAGPFPEPTSFGYFLMLGLLSTVALRGAFRSGQAQFAAAMLVIGGVLAPVSRSAWIGAVMGVAIVRSYRRGIARLVVAAGGLALFVLVLGPLAESSRTVAELVGTQGEAGGTADYRRRLLARGLEEVARKPVLGGSYRDVSQRMADLKQGEGIIDYVNGYLFIALHAGLVGLSIFITVLAWPAVRVLGARRRARRDAAMAEPAAFVAAASIAMLLLTPLSGFGGFAEPIFAILVGMSALLARRPVRWRSPEAVVAQNAEPVPA